MRLRFAPALPKLIKNQIVMKYYAMGIQYDTDCLEIAGLPTNLMVEADDIEQVVDKISDETGWLVETLDRIIPVDDENPPQVQLRISTDIGFTADFLRELANNLDDLGMLEDYETFRGVATIVWPDGE